MLVEEQSVQLGRHGEEAGDRLVAAGLRHRGGIPRRHQHAGTAEPHCHLKPAIEAGIVEERRGAADHVALVDAELHHSRVGGGDTGLVRDEHRLRQARGAAGEDDAERGIVAELHVGRSGAG